MIDYQNSNNLHVIRTARTEDEINEGDVHRLESSEAKRDGEGFIIDHTVSEYYDYIG